MVYAVRYFGRVGFGDPEARFFSLLGHSLFGRAGTVGPEVLNFLCSALPSVESVLVTLRHDFFIPFGSLSLSRADTVGPEVLHFDPFG